MIKQKTTRKAYFFTKAIIFVFISSMFDNSVLCLFVFFVIVLFLILLLQ